MSEDLANSIKQLTNNLRSNLMKNSILFAQELFSLPRSAEIVTFIQIVLPAVLIKTTYEKTFIAIEAKRAVEVAAQNCVFPQTIQALVEGGNTKSGAQSELAIAYLQQLLR